MARRLKYSDFKSDIPFMFIAKEDRDKLRARSLKALAEDRTITEKLSAYEGIFEADYSEAIEKAIAEDGYMVTRKGFGRKWLKRMDLPDYAQEFFRYCFYANIR